MFRLSVASSTLTAVALAGVLFAVSPPLREGFAGDLPEVMEFRLQKEGHALPVPGARLSLRSKPGEKWALGPAEDHRLGMTEIGRRFHLPENLLIIPWFGGDFTYEAEGNEEELAQAVGVQLRLTF
jgi:hypothetical protein